MRRNRFGGMWRRRGFPTRAAMETAIQDPRTTDDYLRLPESARESRSAAERALRKSRERGLSLQSTAYEAGVTVGDIRFWFPRAVGEDRRATADDDYLRLRTFIDAEGERVFVPALGSVESGKAELANAIQWRYVHGDASAAELSSIRGLRVGGVEVASDQQLLLEVARRGEFDPADVYRELV